MSETPNMDLLHRWLPNDHAVSRASLTITRIEVRWSASGDCVLTLSRDLDHSWGVMLDTAAAQHLALLLAPPAKVA